MRTERKQNIMHARRLLRLAKLLARKKRYEFDLSVWQRDATNDEMETGSCGTVCCAMGWACHIPSFRKHGLKLVEDGYRLDPFPRFKPTGVEHKEVTHRLVHNPSSLSYRVRVHIKPVYENVQAAALFFGLSMEEAFSLFLPRGYDWHPGHSVPYTYTTKGPTSLQVAQKIRRTVKAKWPDIYKSLTKKKVPA